MEVLEMLLLFWGLPGLITSLYYISLIRFKGGVELEDWQPYMVFNLIIVSGFWPISSIRELWKILNKRLF